jgi:hypothetical protein
VNFGIDNPTYQYKYIEYHNNLMFARINNSQSASLSNDLGKTWYTTDGTPANFITFGNSYAYGNGVYVYANGEVPRYSYDAIHWNTATNKQ